MTRLYDHDRARRAYECVGAHDDAKLPTYLTVIRDLPLSIRRRGLAVALADVVSRASDDRKAVVVDVLGDVASVGIAPWIDAPAVSSPTELQEWVRGLADDREYIAVTMEALRVVSWLKRAAESIQAEQVTAAESEGHAH